MYCSRTFTWLNESCEQMCASSNTDCMQYRDIQSTPLVPPRLKRLIHLAQESFFRKKSPRGSESGPFQHLQAFASQNVNPGLRYYGGWFKFRISKEPRLRVFLDSRPTMRRTSASFRVGRRRTSQAVAMSHCDSSICLELITLLLQNL